MQQNPTFSLSKLLTVGEVAERSGLAVSALHFYETKGLISSIRTRGNQRRYGRDVLRRLGIIKVAQRVGIPLAEIQTAFETLPQSRTPTVEDWQRLSALWKDDLDARADAERAVQVAPTNENAIAVLAALALRAGDGAKAVALVSEAVTRAPTAFSTYTVTWAVPGITSGGRMLTSR